MEQFNGQALWKSAAYCAALVQFADVLNKEWIAKYARNGHVYPQEQVDQRLAAIPQEVSRWREFAMMRLRIDQPGSAIDARFDAEVARNVAEMRGRDWAPEGTWSRLEGECDSLHSGNAGLIYNMANGRGDGSRGAPAR